MDGKIKELISWLEDTGELQLNDKVGIQETIETGRGVVLQKDKLVKNEVIIAVPSTHQLNYYTVMYHLSKFNNDLNIPGVTHPREKVNTPESPNLRMTGKNTDDDPRYKLYGDLHIDILIEMSSFQLLELYIIAEWTLLPIWSSGQIQSFYQPYFNVWPSTEELGSLPAVWSILPNSPYKYLLKYLPLETTINYKRITALMKTDWNVLLPIFEKWLKMMQILEIEDIPSIEVLFEKFVHIYTIINSRCLYAEVPLKADDVANNFTMVPYVDFLNHTSMTEGHCIPSLNKLVKRSDCGLGEFIIRIAEGGYSKIGQEIFLNYGAHTNDFLLNEYGFTLPDNSQNYINITEIVVRLFEGKEDMVQLLMEYDYWGEYTISRDSVSFRTLVALVALVVETTEPVIKFMHGAIEEDTFTLKTNPILKYLCTELLGLYTNRYAELETCSDDGNSFSLKNVLTLLKGNIDIIKYHLSTC